MTVLEWISAALLVTGGFFFLAGTVGLLRFPDAHSRLHAITKADNLGLGFMVVGIIVQTSPGPITIKLLAIWMLALLASATSCQIIANVALPGRRRAGEERVDA